MANKEPKWNINDIIVNTKSKVEFTINGITQYGTGEKYYDLTELHPKTRAIKDNVKWVLPVSMEKFYKLKTEIPEHRIMDPYCESDASALPSSVLRKKYDESAN